MMNTETFETAIEAAAESKDIESLKTMLSAHPELLDCTIYCPPFQGPARTVLLHLAGKHNTPELAKLALAHGAEIEAICSMPTFSKDTPLETAAGAGSVEVVRLLLAAGAKVDGRVDCATSPLLSALSGANRDADELARSDEVVRMLAAHGADLNRLHRNMHLTPLDIARMWRREQIQAFLIDQGAVGEPREPVDLDGIPGAGILLHVENRAGHVLPVRIQSPQTGNEIDFRQAIVNKKFRLVFSHGLFKSTDPHIELYCVLPIGWPANQELVSSDHALSFPLRAMATLIATAQAQLKPGFILERESEGGQGLPWPNGVAGLALVDQRWPGRTDAPDEDVLDAAGNDVATLLLVMPLSASALEKAKSKKAGAWFDKTRNSKWHQVAFALE